MTHTYGHPDVPTLQPVWLRLKLPTCQLGLQHTIPWRWEPWLLGNIQQLWTAVQPKGIIPASLTLPSTTPCELWLDAYVLHQRTNVLFSQASNLLRRKGAALSLARRSMKPGHLLHSALTCWSSANPRQQPHKAPHFHPRHRHPPPRNDPPKNSLGPA